MATQVKDTVKLPANPEPITIVRDIVDGKGFEIVSTGGGFNGMVMFLDITE